MSVYVRYKRPGGFRALVELLESTPASRRVKMIEAGMIEDAEFTEKALAAMFSWEDIETLHELELTELLSAAPARPIGFALSGSSQDVKDRFIRCCPIQKVAEVRDTLEMKIGPRECDGGKIKLITIARDLEKKNKINTKKIHEPLK